MNAQHVLGNEIAYFGGAQILVLDWVLVKALKQASFEYTSVVCSKHDTSICFVRPQGKELSSNVWH